MWKKKYFMEKKKTPPLEERAMLLKTDLEQIHKKTVQTLETEAKHATQMGYAKEADIGVRSDFFFWMKVFRFFLLEFYWSSDTYTSWYSGYSSSSGTSKITINHRRESKSLIEHKQPLFLFNHFF